MIVSIKKALKDVASDKYDKQNIFLYLSTLFIAGILVFFLPEELRNQSMTNTMKPEDILGLYASAQVISIFIISMFIGLISNGIFCVANNNAIHNKHGVFPNPLKEIGKILTTGLKYFLGSFLVILLIYIVAIVISLVLIKINPLLLILIIPLVLVLVHIWLCVNFRFYITLKFKDWFSFKKSWIMIAKNKRRYGSYIGKSTILLIIYFILFGIIISCSGILLQTIGLISGNMKEAQTAIMAITTIVQVLAGGFLAVYFVNFNSQLLGPIVMKKKKKTITQPI